MTGYGARSMTATLRRVLVRPPQPADAGHWQQYGWRAEPDVSAAEAEHEALREILERAGAEVIVARGERGNPDAIYTYDPLLVGEEGAVLLRPGKDGRAATPRLGRETDEAGRRARRAGFRSWREPLPLRCLHPGQRAGQ